MEITLYNPLLWIGVYFFIRIIRALVKYQIQQKEHKKLLQKAQDFINERDIQYEEFMERHQDLIPSFNIQGLILDAKSIRELQDCLEKGLFTSVDLLMHYINRSQEYGMKLKLISQLNFEKALEMAQNIDKLRKDKAKFEEYKKTTFENGLFVGIPISFKEHVFLKGTRVTSGCINMLDFVTEEEKLFEKIIIQNGFIPFVKTNVPQLLLSIETNNRLYGRALNPYNYNRVPGGSSGGCAGMIATKWSPISVGTDIGGSIRCPSSFCGIYGFKPTLRRVSSKGSSIYKDSSARGQEHLMSVMGPLTSCIDDWVSFTKFMFDNMEKMADPWVAPSKFKQNVYDHYRNKKHLTLGYFTYNQVTTCTKPALRALTKTLDALKKEGHTLIELDTFFMNDLLYILGRHLLSQEMNLDAIGQEDFMPDYKTIRLAYNLPSFLKPLVSKIISFLGNKRSSLYAKMVGEGNAKEVNLAIFKKLEMVQEFEKLYEKHNLDGIVSPGSSLPPHKHGEFNNISFSVMYYALFNLVDHPAITIPRVHIVESEDLDPSEYVDEKYGNDMITSFIKESIEGSEGLPMSVQVSTLSHQDERCLGIAKNIVEVLQKHKVQQDIDIIRL